LSVLEICENSFTYGLEKKAGVFWQCFHEIQGQPVYYKYQNETIRLVPDYLYLSPLRKVIFV